MFFFKNCIADIQLDGAVSYWKFRGGGVLNIHQKLHYFNFSQNPTRCDHKARDSNDKLFSDG